MHKLVEPRADSIAPTDHVAARDCVAQQWVGGSPKALRAALIKLLGRPQVLGKLTDLVRYATDASPYRMLPKVVVVPRSVEDVRQVFAFARRAGTPVTLRAAGSSLSGQAQGDGIVVDVRRHFAGWTVEAGGRRLRCKPGTVLFRANLALAPYGYRLGPDPASASVCTVGGIVANNASGMCCGTLENSYRTVLSLAFVLPSGTEIDTADASAERAFADAEPALALGLLDIKQEIEADPALVETLRRKYRIKNTTGYHMEAFLHGKTPLQIFRGLLVGSEGTLGFISEVVFETVPDHRVRSTAFLIFPDVRAACAAVAAFVAQGAAAVELLDRASLRAVADKPSVPSRWKDLPEEAAGLLVEFREGNAERLAARMQGLEARLAQMPLLEPANFSRDAHTAAQYWNVRNGLLPSVGGARPAGTSLILEDVCFPPERLADGAIDLQRLFERHGYVGRLFGHAAAGNLHFLITPSLNTPGDIRRFDGLLRDVVGLVVDTHGGSLKAEHGTGRNVAPFVAREWGDKLTGLMWKLKELADPEGVLAPGVMLSRHPEEHLQNLHTTPEVEAEIDRCIECGYCEAVCPSRHLTTTPRQRIALRREMLRQPPGSPVARALLREYQYHAVETCAGDGACALACPLSIDTGRLMKDFRHAAHTPRQQEAAANLARSWERVERTGRLALRVNEGTARWLGTWPARAAMALARGVVSHELMPAWLPNIPPPARREASAGARQGASAVYFTACVNRIFGAAPGTDGQSSLSRALLRVSERAGQPLWIPADIAGSCCAAVWHSKGYREANAVMANRVVEKLWDWSDAGRLPVVCDATSCTHGLTREVVELLEPHNRERHSRLTLVDSVAWAHDSLLPALQVSRKLNSVAVHPVCATHHLSLVNKLEALARALAHEVVVPIHATCCGFAGDRGFLHPELTRTATAEQAHELAGRPFDAFLSSNRTCELGMNLGTGEDFRSVIFLLEELTRPELTR